MHLQGEILSLGLEIEYLKIRLIYLYNENGEMQ